MIRVVVAEDSALAAEMLRAALESDPGIQVVGIARDGAQAVALVARLRPDVVTMDVRMPVMDGIEAISRIMEEAPCPILVVSDAVHDDTTIAFRAIQAGAMDVVGKPQGLDARFASDELTRHVRLVASVPTIRRPRRRPGAVGHVRAHAGGIVALAASTGGPPALAAVLGALPPDFPCPILAVQHIAPGFLKGFAEWLGSTVRLRVRVARSGDAAEPGVVTFAPEDAHLELAPRGRLLVTRELPHDGHRPSASVLFQSVAREAGRAGVGVLLTGMGRDGAAGLLAMRRAGGRTICQDEATCAVWGMPRAAVDMDAADKVVPLDRIAAEVVAALG